MIAGTAALAQIPVVAFTAFLVSHETTGGVFACLLRKPVQRQSPMDELAKLLPHEVVD